MLIFIIVISNSTTETKDKTTKIPRRKQSKNQRKVEIVLYNKKRLQKMDEIVIKYYSWEK